MFKSLLNATGITQNIERVKTELALEVNTQINSARDMGRQTAMAAVWGLVAGLFGLLALITVLMLLYAWIAPIYGPVAAYAVILVLLLAIAIAGVLNARQKLRDMPVRKPLVLPKLYIETPTPSVAPHASEPARPASVYAASSSNIRSDPIFSWLFSLVKQAAPSGHTGQPQIDDLVTKLRPQAEVAANEAMLKAVDQLRYGNRKTMFAILGVAAVTGWFVSSRGRGR